MSMPGKWVKRPIVVLVAGALVACASLVGLAHASTKLNIASMTADGQEVRNLSCDLESGSFFAGIAIVGSLAKKKAAFDECAKDGAAFRVTWKWDGSKAKDLKVTGGADAQNACIGRTFVLINGPVKGTCSAVLLAGKKEAAQKAAEALGGGDKAAPAEPAAGAKKAPEPAAPGK